MKSRFITDPQDPFDSFLNTAGAEVYTQLLASGSATTAETRWATDRWKFRPLRP